MLRNWQCEVLSCEGNGLTFHLSIVHILSAAVRLQRAKSDAGEQLQIESQWTMISEM